MAIVGIGAAPGTVFGVYRLSFRRTDLPPADTATPRDGGFVFCQAATICNGARDYRTIDDEGVVDVHRLPPGRYEIYAYQMTGGPGDGAVYSSKAALSIPFEIVSGRAVYLGNYQANRLTRTNVLGLPATGGAIFAIENRAPRDLLAARRKNAQVPSEVALSVARPREIGHPLFVEKGSDVLRLLRGQLR
jgi:hypothetical protein